MNYREALDALYTAEEAWCKACASEKLPDGQVTEQQSEQILQAFEVINRSFNGRKPLETENDIPKQIDRYLSEAVSRIINVAMQSAIRELSQTAELHQNMEAVQLLTRSLRISAAWEALLGGEASSLLDFA